MTMAVASPAGADSAAKSDRQLQALITSRLAHCVSAPVDPDEWFPLASEPAKARSQASHALALCAGCPVRAECLELSLRHWDDVGRYGIWGGMLATERRLARRKWLAGVRASTLVESAGRPGPAGQGGSARGLSAEGEGAGS